MEIFFEDLSIKWPKRVFWFLIAVIFTTSIFYGLFTGDARKGAEFYLDKSSLYVTGPLINNVFKKAEKIGEIFITPLIESLFNNTSDS